MHVIVKEAMANGRLTDRNANPAFAPKLAKLQAAADKVRGRLGGGWGGRCMLQWLQACFFARRPSARARLLCVRRA
jgi:hypothetical protein